jgi:hypothetical protein
MGNMRVLRQDFRDLEGRRGEERRLQDMGHLWHIFDCESGEKRWAQNINARVVIFLNQERRTRSKKSMMPMISIFDIPKELCGLMEQNESRGRGALYT